MAERNNLCMLGFKPEQAIVLGGTYGTATAAGSTIADATQLTCKVSVVSGADGSKGVIMPLAGLLEEIIVKNADNAVLKVYPTTASDKLNGGSAGASVSVAAYAGLLIKRISATDNIALEIPAA